MMIAAKTGLTGLVVIENSARPPLAAAQVHAISDQVPRAPGPGKQYKNAPRRPPHGAAPGQASVTWPILTRVSARPVC